MLPRTARGDNSHRKISQRQENGAPIYVNGRAVGHVAGGVFHKRIQGSKHMLRKPRAIALDVQSVRDAQQAGATHAEITDTESGAVYRAGLDTILRDGQEFDRGFGRQVFLPLDDWQRPDLGEQMALFAEVTA